MNKVFFLIFFFPLFLYAQNPNYSEDIAPILYNKCLQCHNSNGIAPLTLENYAQVVSSSGLIEHVASSGEMPPWPPDTLYQSYSYENTLTSEEINKIVDWVLGGVPLGDTSLLPPLPNFSSPSNLGPADLTLQIPTYTSNATSSDDYVCFSIPTNLAQNRTVRAIEVVPGNLQTVHHVLVSIDPFPNNSVITTANCMGPEGDMIYSYAPGSKPLIFPDTNNMSFGVELTANSSITLAMHYPEGSAGEIDSTKVNFYFYPQNTSIRVISNDFLINEGLFGTPFLLPPNQITEITGSFGPTVQDYSLMSVFPHMHLLGKDMEIFAVTSTNDTINLIKINKWDFEWQGAYFFKKFIKLPYGSMIYAKGTFDNTASLSNPNPVLVQSGFNTEDEMFIGGFQYLPYQNGDEYISLESNSIITNFLNTSKSSNSNLISVYNFLGQKSRIKRRVPLIFMYDDNSLIKKVIVK